MMLLNPQISLFVKELVANPEDVNRLAGVVTAAPGVASFLMAPLWGRLGDRSGHAGILGWALIGAAIAVPWAGLAGAWQQLLLVRIAMGAFTSAINPSTHSVAAHAVDERRTAGAFSLLSSAQMFGACAGPFISGPLATVLGIRILFPITAVLFFIAAGAARRVSALRTAEPEAEPEPEPAAAA
jgi:DHA1 family multidrug resistance protein-like MFS transporter